MDKDVRRRSFTKLFWCSLQPPVIEFAELSPSASVTTTTRSRLSSPPLPPVPQNLSPSLAVSASARLPRQILPHRPGLFSRDRVSFFLVLRHPCWNALISRNALASGSRVLRQPGASVRFGMSIDSRTGRLALIGQLGTSFLTTTGRRLRDASFRLPHLDLGVTSRQCWIGARTNWRFRREVSFPSHPSHPVRSRSD